MKFNRWMEMISGPRNESYSSPDLFRTPGMVPASSGLALGNDTEMTDESRVSHALLFLPFPRVFLPKTMVAYHGTRRHSSAGRFPPGSPGGRTPRFGRGNAGSIPAPGTHFPVAWERDGRQGKH